MTTEPTVTAGWMKTILNNRAEGLDLGTGEGVNEFTHQANSALRGVPFEALQALALDVGAGHPPYDEHDARRVIVRNWIAAACGLGTDADLNAGTHCKACRTRYNRLPGRAESLWFATNICPAPECGFYESVRDEHGRTIVERPAELTPVPVGPDTRRQRLARAIAPTAWYRGKPAPTLRTAIGDRVHVEFGSVSLQELRDLPADIAETARLDWLPALARRVDPYVGPDSLYVPPLRHAVLHRVVEEVGAAGDRAIVGANRAGWHTLYFLASRAHRGAVRLHRAAAELQAETRYVAIWASYGVDDRENKDGDL